MKRLLAIWLAAGLFAFALVGCGRSAAQPAQVLIRPVQAAPSPPVPVRVVDRGTHWEVTLDYTTGLTPRQMGYALRKHNIEIKRF